MYILHWYSESLKLFHTWHSFPELNYILVVGLGVPVFLIVVVVVHVLVGHILCGERLLLDRIVSVGDPLALPSLELPPQRGHQELDWVEGLDLRPPRSMLDLGLAVLGLRLIELILKMLLDRLVKIVSQNFWWRLTAILLPYFPPRPNLPSPSSLSLLPPFCPNPPRAPKPNGLRPRPPEI